MISLAIVLTILVCVEVAVRYFAHVPILWVEELALYIVFWFYLTAAVYATYRRRHIVGGIVHILFKDKARVTICFDIFAAAVCVGISCLMTYLSYEHFIYSLKVNPTTTHLQLPDSYARLSLLVTFPLMAFYFLLQFAGSIRDLIRGVSTVPSIEVEIEEVAHV